MAVEEPPSSINEFVVTGDYGFKRFDGPFEVEKEGTKWTVLVPDDVPDSRLIYSLLDDEGHGAVLIADCEAVAGGLIDVVDAPEGEGAVHVVVDQYPRGDPT